MYLSPAVWQTRALQRSRNRMIEQADDVMRLSMIMHTCCSKKSTAVSNERNCTICLEPFTDIILVSSLEHAPCGFEDECSVLTDRWRVALPCGASVV